MGEATEEVRRFSELEVLVLKRRCTGASYKRVVPLTVSGRSRSGFEDSVSGEGEIVGGKRAKPDIGRDCVLRDLIATEIRSKASELHTPIFLIQFHNLEKVKNNWIKVNWIGIRLKREACVQWEGRRCNDARFRRRECDGGEKGFRREGESRWRWRQGDPLCIRGGAERWKDGRSDLGMFPRRSHLLGEVADSASSLSLMPSNSLSFLCRFYRYFTIFQFSQYFKHLLCTHRTFSSILLYFETLLWRAW